MLAYLARYTHRVAIANSRLVGMDRHGVTFSWKDYRARSAGKTWRKTITLTAHEFIRRFLLHVLPDGFHRILHYGLLASSRRAGTITRIRQTIAAPMPATTTANREAEISAKQSDRVDERRPPCPCCGGRMILVERFAPGTAPRTILAVRIDTS
ncbi:Putative transposase [Bosea robiniae]|uniref:Transposase n=1 Tax=Bosea robiniae TaxID=1036780 RepID=A0ABY0NZ01_9HYPH|nr:Putative transposase [Bosea robiniae]